MKWNWIDSGHPERYLSLKPGLDAAPAQVQEIVHFPNFERPTYVQADGKLYGAGIHVDGIGVGFPFSVKFVDPDPGDMYYFLNPGGLNMDLVEGVIQDAAEGRLALSDYSLKTLNVWLRWAKRQEGFLDRLLKGMSRYY